MLYSKKLFLCDSDGVMRCDFNRISTNRPVSTECNEVGGRTASHRQERGSFVKNFVKSLEK